MNIHAKRKAPNAKISHSATRHSAWRGFSLFEMTLVVLILGIIAAALIPPIGNNLTSPRLRTAANVLATDLEYCASESIAQPGAPRSITFDLVNNKYTLKDVNAGTTLKFPGDGQDYINDFATGRNVQFAGVTITSVVAGVATPATIAFDAYGKPQLLNNLVITLSYNSRTLTVTLNSATGDVTIAGG
jgi:prepilin-type N-terminal cleavage/methylation domain-containing protein